MRHHWCAGIFTEIGDIHDGKRTVFTWRYQYTLKPFFKDVVCSFMIGRDCKE